VDTDWSPGIAAALARARRGPRQHLLLDYDGTLVPIARSPELAAPDEELLLLLSELAASAAIDVEIVSGRTHESLEGWLGHLPVALSAEHGFWHRPHPGVPWQPAARLETDRFVRVRPILQQFTENTPGAHLETKTASLAWHYRGAPRKLGARRAHELQMLLGGALRDQPLDVLRGKKVLEVRLRGVSKAMVAHRVLARMAADTAVVAIGDDCTDDDLFRALPPCGVTIAVGPRPSCAQYRVENHHAVRSILRSMLSGDCPANGLPRDRQGIEGFDRSRP
jgi:trehalose 6-phosphate synthase/phosphatase